MDTSTLFLDSPVSAPDLVGKLDTTVPTLDDKKMEFAKQFESVLMHRVLEQMKNSIGEWGSEEELTGADLQTYDLFWFHLGEEIGGQGGLGLWKQIYQTLTGGSSGEATDLDQSL